MRISPLVFLTFLAIVSHANTPEGFENKGDALIMGGNAYPVLRHTQKIVAFLRPGASVPNFSRRWNLPGFSFSTRSQSVRRGIHTAFMVETDSLPQGKSVRLDSLLASEKNIEFTRPVYFDALNRSEFTVTNRVTIKWRHPPSQYDVDAWIQSQGLRRSEQLDAQTYAFELSDPDSDPMARCAAFSNGADVEWAEPELLFEMRKHFTPNDPLYPGQWNLRNTAQSGFGTPGADVKADQAWNIEQGDPAIIVAILDDGVETTHPDLAANILAGGRNYSGVGSFTNPNPSDPNDQHGTAVAGVTAAVGNNGIGSSGVAPRVKILPIKLSTGSTWASSTAIAQAFRWAADTLDVDVLSNSWGLSPASSSVRDAIRDASVRGRSPGTTGIPGKGSLVFVSTGNDASDFKAASFSIGTYVPAGSYRIGFRYQKNGTGSFEDRMCIDDLSVSSSVSAGLFESFGGGVPAGWDNNGTPSWLSNDTLYYSGSGDARSICSSAPLGSGLASEIRLPLRAYAASDFVQLGLRRSSQANDVLLIRFYNGAGTLVQTTQIPGGLDIKTDTVSFPASSDSSLAIGSSSEYDFRSGYSQYSVSGTGRMVDFVAPSSGVWLGVASTDRSGALGYDPTAYTTTFGGTSAACPLAAGIGALVFSRYPNYTSNHALDLLRRSSDKIGGVTYSGGYAGGIHKEYGYGRMNAFRALTIVDQPPVFTARPDTVVNENQFLQFTLSAADADGDPISFSVLNALTSDTIAGNVFQWTPGYSDAGVIALRFVATDGAMNDTDTVLVTVNNVDRPPSVNAGVDRIVSETQLLAFTVNGTDPDGDAVTLSALNLPSGASFTPASGAFNWTPDFSQSGVYSLRFRGTSNSLADTDTVVVTVNNVDQPPVVNAGSDQGVNENQALGFTVTGTDPDGGAVTLSALNLPGGAVFTPATGAFSWMPTFVQSGSYSLRFRGVSGGLSDTDTVLVTVNNTDRPPSVNAGADQSVNENQLLTFAVGSSDPDGDAVSLSLISPPAGASIVGGNFTWTPTFSQSGVYSIRVRGQSNSLSDTDTVAVTVNNVDQPPVVNAGADQTGSENQLLTFTVTGTDLDGDAVILSALNLPGGATFTPATGVFSWTPNFSESGVYVLRFRGSSNALADTDTVLVTINNVDRAPTVNAGSDQIVNEGLTLSFPILSSDPDGDAVTLSLISPPAGASITGGNFNWTPTFSQSGVYSIRVRGQSNSLADTDTVVVTVNQVDAPPVVNAGVDRSVNENTLINLTVTASDFDGDAVTLSALNLPSGATFTPATGVFSWTPTTAQAGTYSLRFRGVSNALSDTDTVVVIVSNLDQPPVVDAGPDQNGTENQSVSFSVTVTDPDLDAVTLSLLNPPAGSSFTSGTFDWIPTFAQSGSYALRFRGVSNLLSDTDTVVVNIANVDRAPSVNAGIDTSTGENQLLSFTVTGSDPDADIVMLSSLVIPSGAVFTPATGVFSWTPNFNQAGIYTAIFRGVANSLADTDTVIVTVTNTDQPPVVNAGPDRAVNENQALVISVTATDPELDSVALTLLNPPSGSSFSAGNFTWTPSFIQAGSYSLRFRGLANSLADTDTVIVTVNGLDGAPSVNAGVDRAVNEVQLLTFTVTASDPDGDAVTLSALNLPAGAGFTPATGIFSWTPTYAQSGSYALRFRGVANALADTDTVVVTVGNIDRPPSLITATDTSLLEQQPLTRIVSGSDPDGDIVTLSTGAIPAGATFNAGVFSWTPGYSDSGMHIIRFYARSGSLADSDDVFLYVGNVDRPPVLDSIYDTTSNEGQAFVWQFSATDADGDSIRYQALLLPAGATFTGREFRWTPSFIAAGTYQIWVAAISPAWDSVGAQADIQTPTLRILNTDRPPVIAAITPKTVIEADTLRFNVSSSDPDGDAAVITARGLPPWATFNGVGLTGTPGFNDSGPYLLSFIATAQGLSDTEWVNVRVVDNGTGLGVIRLVANAPGAEFLAMSAGPGESGWLGSDSVDIPGMMPGWYTFAARRIGYRTSHFSVRAAKDSTLIKRVTLEPSIPIAFAAAETVLVNGTVFGVTDSSVMALGDLDNDGKEDILVVSKEYGPWVLVLRDSVAGRDLRYSSYVPPFPNLDSNLSSIKFVDWNFDGFQDLLAATPGGQIFMVYGSDSGYIQRQNLLTRPGEIPQVFAEDWDLDGLPDLWVSSNTGLFVYRNSGSVSNPILSVSPVEIFDQSGAPLAGMKNAIVTDLNGDGFKDLLYSDGQFLRSRTLRFAAGSYGNVSSSRLLSVAGKARSCPSGCAISLRVPENGMPRLLFTGYGVAMTFHQGRITGDLNGDARVDNTDRDLLLLRWGYTEINPGWLDSYNSWVDGTWPEQIDIKDFADMADSWGKQE